MKLGSVSNFNYSIKNANVNGSKVVSSPMKSLPYENTFNQGSVSTALRSYINFTGNAPAVTKATIVSTGDEDIVIPKTENGRLRGPAVLLWHLRQPLPQVGPRLSVLPLRPAPKVPPPGWGAGRAGI